MHDDEIDDMLQTLKVAGVSDVQARRVLALFEAAEDIGTEIGALVAPSEKGRYKHYPDQRDRASPAYMGRSNIATRIEIWLEKVSETGEAAAIKSCCFRFRAAFRLLVDQRPGA